MFTYEGKNISVTVSIGIATHHEDERPDQLIQRADKALYSAKAAGRNLVRSDGESAA